jgi:predicted metal-dependent phosphoesterase TrpH
MIGDEPFELVMKVELHAHTADDPVDRIPHTTEQLIDHAAALGYGALAVTLHDRWFDAGRLEGYARERGITLISGIERTLNGKHVLILNAPREVERARSWADVAAIKRDSRALVVAPHPFYPIGSAVGRRGLRDASGVVDALELNAMYTRHIDFNGPAVAWSREHGLPLVGNTDLHRLAQLGTTASIVDVEDGAPADTICDAIRAGRVRVESRPLPLPRASWLFTIMLVGGLPLPRSLFPAPPITTEVRYDARPTVPRRD